MKLAFTFLLLLSYQTLVAAQTMAVQYPKLRKTLDSLAYVDQWPMQQLVQQKADSAGRNLEEVQQTNSARHQPVLARIVQRYGFPGIKQVGKEGAFEFWFLVQHADAYPTFQRTVLGLMQEEVAKHNASARDYAYLIDRVAINAGQLQEYGTQLIYTGPNLGKAEPRPMRDPRNVDKRRAALGMESLEAYLTQVDKGRGVSR
jgi:hypothetical protein